MTLEPLTSAVGPRDGATSGRTADPGAPPKAETDSGYRSPQPTSPAEGLHAAAPLELPFASTRGLVFAVAYIVVWYMTWNLSGLLPGGTGVSLWYPTAGLTMALLLAFGGRVMPLAFIAGFVGIVAADRTTPSIQLLIFAALGSGIPVLCYALAARFLTGTLSFDRRVASLRSAVLFLIVMPLAAMATSFATVAPVFLSGGLPARAFIDMWLGWWLGDLLGLLTVTPALLVIVAPIVSDWAVRRPVRLAAATRQRDPATSSMAGRIFVAAALGIAGVALLAAAGLPYSRPDHTAIDGRIGLEFGFLLFLPLIGVGIRFGVRGTTVAILAITLTVALAVAWTGTSVSSGPYQLLIGSMAAMGLALGAAVSARNDAMASVEAARQDLENRVAERTRALRDEVDRRSRAEAQARAAQAAAEAASSAKSTALSQMTHEFRTPLNAIIGFSDMMRGELLGPLGSPKYVSYAEHINSSGQHLLALLDDIIDLSRVEAGMITVAADRIDLADLAREASALLAPDSEPKKIRLTLNVPDEAPIIGDACRVRQILLNLLSNAVKYTQAGGAVEMAVTTLDDGRVQLSITDNGRGIDPDDLAHLGQPFFRGHHAERLEESGSGIGLTVVFQYARAHNATVAFDSNPGDGTRVTVVFPRPARSNDLAPAETAQMKATPTMAADPPKHGPTAAAMAAGQ